MPRKPSRPTPQDDAAPGDEAALRDACVDLDAADGIDVADTADAVDDVDGPADAAELFGQGAEHRRFAVRRDPQVRLDKYLQLRLRGISRNQLQKLIDLGGVQVNDRQVKASTPIRQGDVIDVILPPPPVKYLQPEPIPLDVLYEDDDFIVVNKQAGLIVHPARSHLSGTLLNALAHHFHAGASKPAHVEDGTVEGLSRVGADDCRPGVVHRLDKNTTGVIVVAKRDEAHWQIARQFESRDTLKAYLALVHGTPDPSDAVGGVIDQPIGKHPTIREAMAVRHDSAARASVTLFRVRRRYRGYTLLELELKTGRTHQIRVHLSYIGCPIVGDLLYGGEAIGETEITHPPEPAGARRYLTYARTKEEALRLHAQLDQRHDLLIDHPALHAALLQFKHPTRQQRVTFTAPVHAPMIDILRRLEPHRIDGPIATEGFHVNLDEALSDLDGP